MKVILLFICLIIGIDRQLKAQKWTKKLEGFPVEYRYQKASFSIGTKGYIVSGNLTNDFIEWDQSTNRWSQKVNYIGNRQNAITFVIGDKGYLGTGIYGKGWLRDDFWEYDPTANSWKQKSGFSHPRAYGASFTINSKGYVVAGLMFDGYDIPELWEWDQVTDSWTKRATFPGGVRCNPFVFTIGNKAYIGGGSDNSTYRKDFWEWDQITDTWNQLSDFPGESRPHTISFTIRNKAYVGLGSNFKGLSDFWQWDPNLNVWNKLKDFPDTIYYPATSFVINDKGYALISNRLYEFNPDTIATVLSIKNLKSLSDFELTPNPNNGIFSLNFSQFEIENLQLRMYNVLGETVYYEDLSKIGSTTKEFQITNLKAGIYFCELANLTDRKINKIVIK